MKISNMWKNVPNHQPAMAISGKLEGSCRGTGLKKWCRPVVFVALQPLIKIDMSIKSQYFISTISHLILGWDY